MSLRAWIAAQRRRRLPVITHFDSDDYARAHSLPSVTPDHPTRPLTPIAPDDPFRDPPFYRAYRAPVVNGVRVLGRKPNHD